MRNHQIKIKAQPESGQAIVIIAVAMVAMIGFLGLVVDGGGLFFLQRDTQNATDAAVIAATYARCTSEPLPPAARQAAVEAAGYAAAEQNGFYNGYDGRVVEIHNPPLDGLRAGDDHYIQVDITATKPSLFIQLVYKGPLAVSTRAIGYCLPPFDPSTVRGITGLAEVTDCSNTIKFGGSNAVIEDPGGVYSNGNIQFSGSDVRVNGEVVAVGVVDESPGTVYLDQPPQEGGGATVINSPLAGVYEMGHYAPGGTIAASVPSGFYHAMLTPADDPGRWPGGTWTPNYMLSGLYYVASDVNLSRASFDPVNGVSVVATGTISANGVQMSQYYINGILLWSNATTNCPGGTALSASGAGTDPVWHGLIYAPNGSVKVQASGLTLIGVIIGQQVEWDGSTSRLIPDNTILPPRAPLVRVAE